MPCPRSRPKTAPRSSTRTGARGSRSCSATAGRCRPMTGTRRCCSSSITAFASSPMTAAAMAAPARSPTATTWIIMPTTSRRLTAHLDLKNAVHVGHSTGGGEVVHYIARHGESRVAKAAIISAVPPLMVQTPANPGGLPKDRVRRIAGAARRQPLGFLSRAAVRSVLWLQPARRQAVGGHHPELVAPGHDGRRQSALRRHRRLLADRFHRGPEEDQRAGAGDAWRRRPDRALCRLRAAVGEASEERHAEDLQGLSARHADHGSRHHQRRPAGVHQSHESHPVRRHRHGRAGRAARMPGRSRRRGVLVGRAQPDSACSTPKLREILHDDFTDYLRDRTAARRL